MARWTGVNFSYSKYHNGAWLPSDPSIPLGEGVLVKLIPDYLKPFAPISAAPNCLLNQIVLCFNRDIEEFTAVNPLQYVVTGPGSPTVTAVTFDTSAFGTAWSSRRVFLTLSSLSSPSSPLTASADYKVSFSPSSGIKDLFGNPIQNGSFTKFKANLTTPRLVLAEPDCGNNEVIVNYDRAMGASAGSAGNYTLTPSAGIITAFLLTPSTASGPNRVRLKFSGALNPATLYTLSVNSSVMSACGGALPAGSQISFVCNPNISGMKYDDVNGNGVFNPATEWPMPNWKFKLDTFPTTSTPTYAVTDINGIFRFSVPPPAVSYNLTDIIVPGTGWIAPTPASGGAVRNITAAAFPGPISEDFGNRPTAAAFNKLKVTLTAMYDAPLRTPCVSQSIYWVIRYENTGNRPLTGQQVRLLHPISQTTVTMGAETYINPPAWGVTDPTPSYGLISGMDRWTLPTLTPGAWGVIVAKYTYIGAPGAAVNATASTSVTGSGSSPFLAYANCSLDPNDKTVSPRGCGSEGFIKRDVPLTYTVRFQNVGTGPAYRVVIRDMLDSDLDVNSVQMIDASHPYVLEANGQELVWTFEDIGLPPTSSDELGSQGYVKFTVQPQPSLPANTVINNSADIYFDLNAPITTVTTVNTITDNPVPVSSFTGPTSAVAVGAPTDFTYTGGTPGATYFWNFGPGATPATSTAQNPTGVTWSSSGYKLVSLQVSLGGCVAEPALTTVGVGTPLLEIRRDGNEMVLTWHDENFTLQETDRLDLPESWHDSTATVNVLSGTVTARVPIIAGSMFYRLAL